MKDEGPHGIEILLGEVLAERGITLTELSARVESRSPTCRF
ncbi:hypothetical protein ACQP2K_31260 [Microbispora siamensis]